MSQHKEEVTGDLPIGLRILCLLSFFGFIYALIIDVTNHFIYASPKDHVATLPAEGLEKWEDVIDSLTQAGLDVSDEGMGGIALVFMIRIIFSVLAALGVAFMYFKFKAGFYTYAISQVLYVAIPVMMLGTAASAVPSLGWNFAAINLIYVALYVTQLKHLTR